MTSSELLTRIQGRRDLQVSQALSLLSLFPASDTESKHSILSMVSRFVADPRVAAGWINLAIAENDTRIRGMMLSRVLDLDPRGLADGDAYLRLLVQGLTLDEWRVPALNKLGAMAKESPQVPAVLVKLYAEQRTAGAQREILLALCSGDFATDELAAFLLSVSDRVDADLKVRIVGLLLLRAKVAPDQLSRWLAPEEPPAIRRQVLEYLLDRALPLEQAFVAVFTRDSDSECRRSAVRAFAALDKKSPAGVVALLDALRRETDAEVRQVIVDALIHSLETTPEILAKLLEILRQEKSEDVARQILRLLTLQSAHSQDVRTGLQSLAAANLRVDTAAVIYSALGRLAAWDPAMLDYLLKAYTTSTDDFIRSIILQTLAAWPDPDDRLIPIYLAACQAPAPALRAWGAQGLLMLPMTPERVETVSRGAELLLDAQIDPVLRRALARKLARIPAPTRQLLALFKQVLEQSPDAELKNICRPAYDRPAATAETPPADWALWLHRVTVDHSVEGIFPEIYARYEEDPGQAYVILKAVVLDPQLGNSCYQNRVSDSHILSFLLTWQAWDEDLTRYCLNWILEKDERYGNPNQFLAYLKAHPEYPWLRDNIWQIFQTQSKVAGLNNILLLELLVLICGSDEGVARQLRERLGRQTEPAGAAPYLAFLFASQWWEPAVEILVAASRVEAVQNAEHKEMFKALLIRLGMEPPQKKSQPSGGLLDE